MRGRVVVGALCVMLAVNASAQEYYSDSHQITDQHRFEPRMWSGWGHHLGHMVRTATQGLWYVDDTGNDVWTNPAVNYLRFDGTRWILVKTFAAPHTIQQNFANMAIGDTIYSYGVNTDAGFIDEAVYDTRTNTPVWNLGIRYIGGGTNYIGAAISPNGTRVVWWTRAVNPEGPSDWVYMYNDGSGWSSSIGAKIAGADFSYVFASFLNDSVFYVGGEVPHGYGPYTFEVAAGKVTLGSPLSEFTKMKGSNKSAWDIWVNRANGDVHLFLYGALGNDIYFYKPAGGAWTDTANFIGVGLSCCRIIDSPDGNLYMILSGGGTRMMVIPKSSITGMINFSSFPEIKLSAIDDFANSGAIFPEVKEFQTTPVSGINFACPGMDAYHPTILRHTSVKLNPGTIALRVQLPNGNETLVEGLLQTIYWYRPTSPAFDMVRIDYSLDGGARWILVAANAPNSGSYTWTVPPTLSTNCLIRVSNAAGGSPADTSDAPFAIVYVPDMRKPPLGRIIRPTKDTTVYSGMTMSFHGVGSDSDGYITNYVWKAGDGAVQKGVEDTFNHAYTTAGAYYATLEVEDNDTLRSKPDSVMITVLPSTGVGEDAPVPQTLALYPNYPNPFNAGTVISYSLDRVMHVRVRIFSITGEEVVRLVDEVQSAGMHRTVWDARNNEGRELASGLYVCRLETPAALRVQKILLLR